MAKKESNSKFWLNLAIILIVMLVKNFVLSGVIGTLVRIFISGESLSVLLSTIITSIVCGLIIAFFIYRDVRDSNEEKRLVLEHFREIPCTNENIKAYIKSNKSIKRDIFTFIVALAVMLFIEYAAYIFASPLYLVDYALDFGLIYGGYWLLVIRSRYKLYKQWDADRLHR